MSILSIEDMKIEPLATAIVKISNILIRSNVNPGEYLDYSLFKLFNTLPFDALYQPDEYLEAFNKYFSQHIYRITVDICENENGFLGIGYAAMAQFHLYAIAGDERVIIIFNLYMNDKYFKLKEHEHIIK